jgi:Flp pilus assembly protein TadB
MPTRKQRRRRAKGRRHEYEYVFVDEEGNEVEVDPDDVRAERAVSRNGRVRESSRANVRVQAPSWRRVAKRGLIFAPLMFVTVMLIDSSLTLPQVAVQTVFLLAIFLPFSYFMDSFMYRRHRRRTGAPAPKR